MKQREERRSSSQMETLVKIKQLESERSLRLNDLTASEEASKVATLQGEIVKLQEINVQRVQELEKLKKYQKRSELVDQTMSANKDLIKTINELNSSIKRKNQEI